MEYEDVVLIPTPEGVEVRLTLAGLGSRFVSAIVDAMIQAAVLLGLGLVLGGANIFGVASGGIAIAIYVVLAFLVVFGYDVFFEVLAGGRTPGKRLNGLRVVRSGGHPIGFLSSAVRNALRLVDILPGAYLVGCASILVTPRNQRIGDLVADALVVRERRAADAELDVFAVSPRQSVDETVYASWDTSAVTNEELQAVRSFLERRYGIERAARNELAATLAARLRPKVAGAPSGLQGERFLEALAAAKASRR